MKNIELKLAIFSAVLIFGGCILDIYGVLYGNLIMVVGIIIGGYFKAKEGVEETIKNKALNVEILMVVAAIGAIIIGDYFEAGVLIVIFAVSGALETISEEKSRAAIDSLMKLAPSTALKLVEGKYIEVDVEVLEVGDVIKLAPGQRVSVDCILESDYGIFDSKAITGESKLVELTKGDSLYSGFVNLNYITHLKVLKPSNQSMLQKIISLVEDAQDSKPKVQRKIELIESYYVSIVLIVAFLVAFFLPLVTTISPELLQYKAIVILIVASPCAVMASIIPATLSTISSNAKGGILIKSGSILEQTCKIDAICFDKTGTLTLGQLDVIDVQLFSDMPHEVFMSIAASIENNTTHKIGASIVNYVRQNNIELLEVSDYEEVVGLGVKATVNEESYLLGNSKFVDYHNETNVYGTQVFLKKDDIVLGLIVLEDQVRPSAITLIENLKKRNITPIMITGDNQYTASIIASKLGIKEFYAQTLPDQKVSILNDVKTRYKTVAMVGDGINDAPALATSDVAIAMGLGSEIAIDTADIVLVNDEISNINKVIKSSFALKHIIYQNLIFAVCIITMMLVINVLFAVNLPFAVVMHEGSTILVILNGLRLLKVR